MVYLWFCAIVSLVFGILFLSSPELLGSWGKVLNVALFALNGQTMRYRFWIGLVLLVIAGWVFFVGLQTAAWYLTATWIVALVFALLYLLVPHWLSWLSKASNAMLLSTDELAIGGRKVIGVLLLIAAAYIFYGIIAMFK
jgi:hypothetical protein